MFLCILAGISFGHLFPTAFHVVGAVEIAQINLPVAVLIWLMILPMLLKVDLKALVDIAGRQSKSLTRYLGQRFDYIITVCDRARDNCPTFPGDSERIHWGFEDPAEANGSEADRLKAFRRVRNEISERLRLFMALHHRRREGHG